MANLRVHRRTFFMLLSLVLVAIVLFGLVQHSVKFNMGWMELRSIDTKSGGEMDASPPPIKSVQYTNVALNVTSDDPELSFLVRLKSGQVPHDDPQLVHFIQKYYLVPPSNKPYNMVTNVTDTSMGQAAAVNKILKEQKSGFFVECGALDGETRSNTYFFERQLGWQGLLIEGDPNNFDLLMNKHRHANSINACLSVKNTPMKVQFEQKFNIGKISETNLTNKGTDNEFAEVQCFPLYSILLALNIKRVDYFSLDVEGAELDVLRTIPFDKLDIRVLSVEYVHDKEGEKGVQDFMESKNFVAHSKVNNRYNLANDIIFVKL